MTRVATNQPGPSRFPWDLIKVDYETTTISQRALCARYGIRSLTLLQRKIKKEHWKKDHERIAAVMVTDALALDGGYPEGYRDDPDRPSDHGLTAGDHSPTKGGESRKGAGATLPCAELSRDGAIAREESLEVARATGLAEIHARAINEQRGHADTMTNLGLLIMSLASVAMTSTDEQEVMDARSRLKQFNSDKETLAGLIKQAKDLIEAGASMKRRALGMDVLKAPLERVDPSVDLAAKAREQVFKRLPAEAMKKMREVAVAIQRLPPPKEPVGPTIDGEVVE